MLLRELESLESRVCVGGGAAAGVGGGGGEDVVTHAPKINSTETETEIEHGVPEACARERRAAAMRTTTTTTTTITKFYGGTAGTPLQIVENGISGWMDRFCVGGFRVWLGIVSVKVFSCVVMLIELVLSLMPLLSLLLLLLLLFLCC